jgi:hypothetical protein
MSNWARKKQEDQESKVLAAADIVLTVSEEWSKDLSEKSGKAAEYITNGFDPDNFNSKEATEPERFRISHIGMINEFRSAPLFWKALEEVCIQTPAMQESLEIFLAGIVSRKFLNTLQNSAVLGSKLRIEEYISHKDIQATYQKSAVLLLILNDSKIAHGHIPGKFFEYLASRRPIIGIGNTKGDTARLLKKYSPIEMCDPNDFEGLKQRIEIAFQLFSENKIRSDADISAFSRRELTRKLVRLLNDKLDQ